MFKMNYTRIRKEIEREERELKEFQEIEDTKDILNKCDIDLFY